MPCRITVIWTGFSGFGASLICRKFAGELIISGTPTLAKVGASMLEANLSVSVLCGHVTGAIAVPARRTLQIFRREDASVFVMASHAGVWGCRDAKRKGVWRRPYLPVIPNLYASSVDWWRRRRRMPDKIPIFQRRESRGWQRSLPVVPAASISQLLHLLPLEADSQFVTLRFADRRAIGLPYMPDKEENSSADQR